MAGASGSNLSEIQVAIQWAQRHEWKPSQSMRRLPTPAHAVWLIESGSIDVTLRDWPDSERRHWRVPAGMAFLAPAPSVRDVVASSANGATWLTLGISITRGAQAKRSNLMDTLKPPHLWRPTAQEAERLKIWLTALADVWESHPKFTGSADALLCDGLARAIAALLWKRFAGTGVPVSLQEATPQRYPVWVEESLARADKDPGISIAELSTASGMSVETYRRTFRRAVGESPQRFLLRRRLEKARTLLTESDDSVLAIALQNGFISQAHFTRRYREAFGLPPAEHRSALRSPGI